MQESQTTRQPVSRPASLVILGPTASGKTRLGVAMARGLGGEIVSADSRQVYRGLDIGAGKDLDEYVEGGPAVAYHLIDIVDLDQEYSVFDFQQAAFGAVESLWRRGRVPIIVGGSGLYLESLVEKYRLVPVPEDPVLRQELAGLDDAELAHRLRQVKPDLHNQTDLAERERTIRAIEIALYSRDHDPEPAPDLRPLVLGIRWPRQVLHERIRTRLGERLDSGLIEEVAQLHAAGVSWERLDRLGLEYRWVSEYLRGRIRRRGYLLRSLGSEIIKFAKRQDSWFRRMERRGTRIHWLDGCDVDGALEVARAHGLDVVATGPPTA